jgi:hypothetical protein
MLYGAIIGGVLNAVGDALAQVQKNKALDRAAPQQVQLGDFTDAFKDYTSQGENIPAVASLLGSAADQDNDRYLKGLERYFPGISQQLKQQGERALSYQQGYISPDQQLDIAQKQAYRALQGGYQGSGMAGQQQDVATARAALANQQYGNQLASQTGAIARGLSPDQLNLDKTLLTPQDLLKRTDANQYYNTDMGNQQRAAAAGIELAARKQFTEGITKAGVGLGGYFGGNMQGGQNNSIGSFAGNSGGWFGGEATGSGGGGAPAGAWGDYDWTG